MAILSRLTGEDVSSRYEALGAGLSDDLFTEYQAQDRVAARAVRVRVVNPRSANLRFIEALAAEMARLARVTHPAVERVLDILSVPESIGIVLEPHRGLDLETRIRKVGAFPAAYAVDVSFAVGEGLQALHRAGAVHGRLAASSVYLSTEGIVKIAEAGISAAAASIPREARPPSLASVVSPAIEDDLAAFGKLVFQLLTGKVAPGTADLVRGPGAFGDRIPDPLSNWVRRLAAGSYPNADEMLRDLRLIRDAVRMGRSMPGIPPPSAREILKPTPARIPAAAAGRTPPASPAAADLAAASGRSRGVSTASSVMDPPLSAAAPAAAPRGDVDVLPPTRSRPVDVPTLPRRTRPPTQDGVRRQPLTDPLPAVSQRAPRRRLTVKALFVRAAVTSLVLGALGLCAILGVLYYLNWLGSTPEVTMPDLRGRSPDQAREMLNRLDLKVDIDKTSIYDSRVPPGHVLRQQPDVGVHTKAGRTVLLFLSKGSRTVKVPDVVGKPLDEAIHLIESAGLHYKNNGDMSSPTMPDGSVLKQFPAPGKVVQRGSSTFVKVSAGPSEEDLKKETPDQPADRTVALTIPADKKPGVRGPSTSGPLHSVEIREVGPSGDEKPVWQGKVIAGQRLEQDVKVDAFYRIRVYLDGRLLHTRLDLSSPNDSPVDTPPVSSADDSADGGVQP